jgi:probable HAF family extracellular repeat protein
MRIQIHPICLLILAVCLASATVSASEFITIGRGFTSDVSADGSVVITERGRWTREHGLMPLPTAVWGVSDDGSVVVGGMPAYRWTAETGIRPLDPLPSAVATAVSGDGNVIGGYISQPARDAWIWTAEDGYRFLGAGAENAEAISEDGRVVVGDALSGSGFRWTPETGLVALGHLGGSFGTLPADLSADGNVVVGQSGSAALQGRYEAFRWTEEGGIKGLGTLPGMGTSEARGISADGLVVAGNSFSGGSIFAWVWDEFHGLRDLEDVLRQEYGLTPTGHLRWANKISADRRTIVGTLLTSSSQNDVWVAYLDHPIGPPLPEFGDYNADGKVGQPDLNLALGKWGQDLPDFAYPWINDLPVGVVGQGELNAVVLNWPASAGPLDLSLAPTNGALTANYDLKNNSAIINYTGTSPVAIVRQQILAGRGGPGFGQSWNGLGITSSTVAAANATEPEARSIGYAENSEMPLGHYTTFRGQPVDDTSLLIAYTRTGDANLDGVVNDQDVTIVSATYAPGVPQPSWALGDFDYNGFVDDADVTLLGVFYNPEAPPLSAAIEINVATAVPEPHSLILLFTAGATALVAAHRMRRRLPTT